MPQVSLTLGLISIVRNNLKLACGVNECTFFSSCTSHCGARCTFFSITQRPDFTAVFIALSAWLKPSAEPSYKINAEILKIGNAKLRYECMMIYFTIVAYILSCKIQEYSTLHTTLTNSNWSDWFVQFCSQIIHTSTCIVTGHWAHKDWGTALHFILNNTSQIQFLFCMLHEAGAHYGRDKHMCWCYQTVWSEGSHHQHLVHGLSNFSCNI